MDAPAYCALDGVNACVENDRLCSVTLTFSNCERVEAVACGNWRELKCLGVEKIDGRIKFF